MISNVIHSARCERASYFLVFLCIFLNGCAQNGAWQTSNANQAVLDPSNTKRTPLSEIKFSYVKITGPLPTVVDRLNYELRGAGLGVGLALMQASSSEIWTKDVKIDLKNVTYREILDEASRQLGAGYTDRWAKRYLFLRDSPNEAFDIVMSSPYPDGKVERAGPIEDAPQEYLSARKVPSYFGPVRKQGGFSGNSKKSIFTPTYRCDPGVFFSRLPIFQRLTNKIRT